MTISEASAFNTIMNRLWGPIYSDHQKPTASETIEAMAFLAERSHKALHAGWGTELLRERAATTLPMTWRWREVVREVVV